MFMFKRVFSKVVAFCYDMYNHNKTSMTQKGYAISFSPQTNREKLDLDPKKKKGVKIGFFTQNKTQKLSINGALSEHKSIKIWLFGM